MFNFWMPGERVRCWQIATVCPRAVWEGESGAGMRNGELVQCLRFRAMEFAFSPCEKTAGLFQC